VLIGKMRVEGDHNQIPISMTPRMVATCVYKPIARRIPVSTSRAARTKRWETPFL